MITTARYLEIHAAVAEGFAHEIEWAETRQPVSGTLVFWTRQSRTIIGKFAGTEGVHEMCARLAQETGYRIATVDYVLWRAANLGKI